MEDSGAVERRAPAKFGRRTGHVAPKPITGPFKTLLPFVLVLIGYQRASNLSNGI